MFCYSGTVEYPLHKNICSLNSHRSAFIYTNIVSKAIHSPLSICPHFIFGIYPKTIFSLLLQLFWNLSSGNARLSAD